MQYDPDHEVAVYEVRLHRYSNGRWRHVYTSTDYDGWHDSEDKHWGPAVTCRGTYRSKVLFKWRKKGSSTVTADWLTGPVVRC